MQDFPQKYYLCVSGEVKERAEEYQKAYNELWSHLIKLVKSMGATDYRFEPSMMLLIGIKFKGEPPKGWTKKRGYSRPPDNKAISKYFTPSGGHRITTHPKLAAFQEWLGCPMSYSYTKGKTNSGWTTIGRLFSDGLLYWYDSTGPILLVIPDVALARSQARAEGLKIADKGLTWKRPKGLKEILPEEWYLMSANHEQKLQANKTKAKS